MGFTKSSHIPPLLPTLIKNNTIVKQEYGVLYLYDKDLNTKLIAANRQQNVQINKTDRIKTKCELLISSDNISEQACLFAREIAHSLRPTIPHFSRNMTPFYWQQAKQELTACDEVMRYLIQHFAGATLTSRGCAFTTLARSIVGQQISVKAADSVWRKVTSAIPAITPHTVASAEQDLLRACGLSARKIIYLQDLSRHFTRGTLNETTWIEKDDEAVIAQLTQVKGIGRWTAEMFLIFHLQRPDVLPLDDIGLQRAISQHYYGNQPVDKKTMRELAKPWQPWRSVATWYLWRSLDPLPVEY